LESFSEIWEIVWPFGTFCVHLVDFPFFGIMYQEKSGNPESEAHLKKEVAQRD
jgi:hypothetical protein